MDWELGAQEPHSFYFPRPGHWKSEKGYVILGNEVNGLIEKNKLKPGKLWYLCVLLVLFLWFFLSSKNYPKTILSKISNFQIFNEMANHPVYFF